MQDFAIANLYMRNEEVLIIDHADQGVRLTVSQGALVKLELHLSKVKSRSDK